MVSWVTLQVHPLVSSLAVKSCAVLIPILVWFPLIPVLITPGSSGHPDPGVLLVSTIRGSEVGVDGLCLLLILRLCQVPLLVVAALHGVEPVHSVPSELVVGVASAKVISFNQHIAFVGPLCPREPPVVHITPLLVEVVGLCHRTKQHLGRGP